MTMRMKIMFVAGMLLIWIGGFVCGVAATL